MDLPVFSSWAEKDVVAPAAAMTARHLLAALVCTSLLAAAEPLADERLATSFAPAVVPGAVGGAVAWFEPDAPEPWRNRLAWIAQRPRPILDGRSGTVALWFRQDAPAFFYECLFDVRGDGDGVARPGDGNRQGLALSVMPPDSTGWSDGDPAHFRRGRLIGEFIGADGRGCTLTGPDVLPGEWVHVALTWDSSRVALHANGREVAAQEKPSLPDLDAIERLWVGVNNLRACSFPGALDQIAAWDRPLNAAEVAVLAGRGRLPDDGHLVLDLPLDQGSALQVRRRAARHPAGTRPTVALPGDGRGAFAVGQPVPVTVAVPPGSGTWQVKTTVAPLGPSPQPVLAERTLTLDALPDRPAEAVLDLAPGRCGAFRIVTTCTSSGSPQHRAALDVAVTVPPPAPRPESMLGDHLEMAEWRGLGTGWTRIWTYEAGWHRYEPRPGVFYWDYLDGLVAEAEAQRRAILLCVTFTPAWASTAPAVEDLEKELVRHGLSAARAAREASGQRCLYPPRDQADWARFLTALFIRYRGRIAAYEMINEPNSPEWHGTPAQYAEMLTTMHRVAKEVDPAALVVGGAGCPGYREWTERIAAAGAAPAMDVLSVHDYQYDTPVGWLRQGTIASASASLTKRDRTVPVWDSESAFPAAARVDGLPMSVSEFTRRYGDNARAGGVVIMTEEQGARREIMARLATLAGGAARTFLHTCSGIQDNRYRQPATAKQVAWTMLASALDGGTRIEVLPPGRDATLAVAVHAPSGRTLALMAERDGVQPLAWPDGATVTACDLFGNPVAIAARDGVLAAPVGDTVLWLRNVPSEAKPLRILDLSGTGPLAAGKPLRLAARVRNPTRRELGVQLRGRMPDTALRIEPAVIVLAPGAEATVVVHLDPGAQPRRGDRPLSVEAVIEDQVWGLAERVLWCAGLEQAMPRLRADPAPEADAAAWRGAGALEAVIDGRGDQVTVGRPNPMFPDRGLCWRGAADCSATLQAGWTAQGLRLRVAVRDDAVVPPPPGREAKAYGWDALEVFVDLRPAVARQQNALRRRGPGTAQVFICAPADEAWDTLRSPPQPAGAIVAEGRARLVAGGWEAEILLRPGEGGVLQAGAGIGLDLALDDADRPGDQPMRVSQLVWQGGADNFRDPGLWGSFVLAGP